MLFRSKVGGDLAVTGNTNLNGSLNVVGPTTTNGLTNNGNISTNTLNTSGLATLNSANIINNASIGGNLAVGGNTAITGALNVSGNTTLTGPQITLGAANGSSVVTVPGLATFGAPRFVTANYNGTLGLSDVPIAEYTRGLQAVDGQVSAVGATASALSAIPNITVGDRKFGCGVGTGFFGSSWAGALGCVGRVAKNIWVNGALSFNPSVTTAFSTTPSVAGRLGVFFQF